MYPVEHEGLELSAGGDLLLVQCKSTQLSLSELWKINMCKQMT